MKKLNIVLGFVFLTLLFTISTVKSLGGAPLTLQQNLLLRGDTSRSYFQIDNYSPNKQICTYSLSEMDPLQVTFEEEGEITIESQTTKTIFGTVSVPSNAPIKTYEGTISVSCNPVVGEVEGSTIKESFDLSFIINVVEEIEGVTTTVPKEEKPMISTSAILTIIIIVVLVIGVGYWFGKRSKKKQ